MKKLYTLRLIFRIAIFLLCLFPALTRADFLNIMTGFNFFRSFSPLHLLWALWVFDMLCQLFPISKNIALGSRKHFSCCFIPAGKEIDKGTLKALSRSLTRNAFKVALVWCAGLAILAGLYFTGLVNRTHIFLLCLLFYIGDLVCVVIFCPFRLMMGNRCCTDCRIFNWDHLMMFSVFILTPSFFATSLLLLSVAVCALWEIRFGKYPERFIEESNTALRCENCTDRLCGGKRRKIVVHSNNSLRSAAKDAAERKS